MRTLQAAGDALAELTRRTHAQRGFFHSFYLQLPLQINSPLLAVGRKLTRCAPAVPEETAGVTGEKERKRKMER